MNYNKSMEKYPFISQRLSEKAKEFGQMFELIGQKVVHVSRNPYVPISTGDSILRDEFSYAITRFSYVRHREFMILVGMYYDLIEDRAFICQHEPTLKQLGFSGDYRSQLKREIEPICKAQNIDFPKPLSSTSSPRCTLI